MILASIFTPPSDPPGSMLLGFVSFAMTTLSQRSQVKVRKLGRNSAGIGHSAGSLRTGFSGSTLLVGSGLLPSLFLLWHPGHPMSMAVICFTSSWPPSCAQAPAVESALEMGSGWPPVALPGPQPTPLALALALVLRSSPRTSCCSG